MQVSCRINKQTGGNAQHKDINKIVGRSFVHGKKTKLIEQRSPSQIQIAYASTLHTLMPHAYLVPQHVAASQRFVEDVRELHGLRVVAERVDSHARHLRHRQRFLRGGRGVAELVEHAFEGARHLSAEEQRGKRSTS